MSDTGNTPTTEPTAHPGRLVFLVILITLAGAFAYFWYFTPTGADWRARHVIAYWMADHPLLAPLGLAAIYILLATLAMPVWWVQLIAGRTFGLVEGIAICQIAATISAGLTAWLAQWSIGDFLASNTAAGMKKLRALEEKLGHNGLLVVMATRLVHVVPFGLSNYLFGLLRIPTRQVVFGTLLGNLPAVAWLVGVGSFLQSGVHLKLGLADLREHLWFFASLLMLNLLLLGLLRLRYLRPEWFRKIGVE